MNEAILKKLVEIQRDLKAPKGQYNNFGKYAYRSCEDILEAVKPLANAAGCVVTLSDEVVLVGDRYYIRATAMMTDGDTGGVVSNTAFAREAADKKGMDDSQVTGTASSYARKYALNGLFAIDDTKDADTDEAEKQRRSAKGVDENKPTEAQLKKMWAIAGKAGVDESGIHEFIVKAFKKESVKDLSAADVSAICKRLENGGTK